MNFSDTLKALNQASAFDLYRMRAAIDRVLDDPRWLKAVQSRLRVGQVSEYFDRQSNAMRPCQILEFRRKQVVVLDQLDGKRWLIAYAAINLDGVDAKIREQPRQGLGRNEVAVGETVGFLDRDQQQRAGRILRLNDKTVTMLCNNQRWRVAYGLLHRVVDADAGREETIELDATSRTNEAWTPRLL